jgi:diguanylate cyclase (GGDEF)-like protein
MVDAFFFWEYVPKKKGGPLMKAAGGGVQHTGQGGQPPGEAVFVLDGGLRVREANAAALSALGLRVGDCLDALPGFDRSGALAALAAHGCWHGMAGGQGLQLRAAGDSFVVATVAVEAGAASDPVTGLPGRCEFMSMLESCLADARRGSASFGLLLVDLNDFAAINDAFGAEVGDGVLRDAALRLTALLDPADRLARIGGNRFAIIQAEPHTRMLSREVLTCLGNPLGADRRKVTLTISVGMSFYPGDGLSAEILAHRAAVALREARSEGGDTYRFYRAGMDRDAQLRCALEHDMAAAIAGDQFLLHYQPQVRLDTGEVVGCEALLRWRHPEHGLLLPDRFIAIAEANGCIGPLGDWVLRQACRQLGAWRATGDGPPRIAVNVSARQLQDPGFAERVAAILQETGVDPDALELEVTESVALRQTKRTAEAIEQIRALGVEFVIDDFGAGYSSLHALEFIPARTLKLDRALTRALRRNQRRTAIVRAAIDLGHTLGMQVLAEGIEEREQAAVLSDLRCDLGQGHAIGLPVPPMELCAWLHGAAERVAVAVSSAARSAAKAGCAAAVPGGGDPAEWR